MADDMCIIQIGSRGQYEATVSQRDYAALTKWRWNYKISAWKYGAKVYARRGGGTKNGTARPTVYMARFILVDLMGIERPSPRHTVHHRDGNALNNVRGNLTWATKSQQSSEQKPRMDRRIRKAIDHARVAA